MLTSNLNAMPGALLLGDLVEAAPAEDPSVHVDIYEIYTPRLLPKATPTAKAQSGDQPRFIQRADLGDLAGLLERPIRQWWDGELLTHVRGMQSRVATNLVPPGQRILVPLLGIGTIFTATELLPKSQWTGNDQAQVLLVGRTGEIDPVKQVKGETRELPTYEGKELRIITRGLGLVRVSGDSELPHGPLRRPRGTRRPASSDSWSRRSTDILNRLIINAITSGRARLTSLEGAIRHRDGSKTYHRYDTSHSDPPNVATHIETARDLLGRRLGGFAVPDLAHKKVVHRPWVGIGLLHYRLSTPAKH
jgi:hypothetical protein